MLLFFIGENVTVFGFHGAQADQSVPITTCATKLVTASGQTCILICPQMIFYDTQLPQSLINLNQLHATRTLVDDSPIIDRAVT